MLQYFLQCLEEVQHYCFRDKSVDIFVFGDYEFLSELYGILGACGKTAARNKRY